MLDPIELLTKMGVIGEPGSQQHFRAILLMGVPGSGKGVQGNILKSIPGFYHFSSGEVFRRLDMSSKLGQTFLDLSIRGELLPDQLVIDLWLANIHAHAVLGDFLPSKHLLVLDGIPRTVVQARMLDPYLDVLKVIHLDCSNLDAMVERLRGRALQEGRPDDADEKVIRNRFLVYEAETAPLLRYYPAESITRIDCLASPVKVAAQILTVMAPLQP
jgi:adenylate kinase